MFNVEKAGLIISVKKNSRYLENSRLIPLFEDYPLLQKLMLRLTIHMFHPEGVANTWLVAWSRTLGRCIRALFGHNERRLPVL